MKFLKKMGYWLMSETLYSGVTLTIGDICLYICMDVCMSFVL